MPGPYDDHLRKARKGGTFDPKAPSHLSGHHIDDTAVWATADASYERGDWVVLGSVVSDHPRTAKAGSDGDGRALGVILTDV